jgi:hypothetical protein
MAAQQIKRLADEHHLERIFIASDMTQQEFGNPTGAIFCCCCQARLIMK